MPTETESEELARTVDYQGYLIEFSIHETFEVSLDQFVRAVDEIFDMPAPKKPVTLDYDPREGI